MKGLLLVLLALAAAPALAQENDAIPSRDPARRGDAASFEVELSYVRFTSFFDGAGKRTPLDRAFSDPATATEARRVAVDATVLAFDGRIVPLPGISAGIRVPLVRDSRSGELSVAGLPSAQGFYREGMAIGDLVADGEIRLPRSSQAWGVGLDAMVKLPAGHWRNLDPDQLPTGDGEVGVGGEASGWARIARAELGLSAGMMALLPRTVGTDVDRGDPRWLTVWESTRVTPDLAIGLGGGFFARAGDRAGHKPVSALQDGGEPGSLAPASSLIAISPFAEWRVRPDTGLTIAVSNSSAGWLFAPAPGGVAIAGKNVMAPEPQLLARMVTVFR